MIEKLYVDGIDVYKSYGVSLKIDSYNSLLAYPPLKPPQINNWLDEDGEEVHLLRPALDTRVLTLNFEAHNLPLTGDFIALLSNKAYHEFKFTALNKTYKLRLSEMDDLEYISHSELFSLQFADDFPLLNYEYVAPIKVAGVFDNGYQLDGKDFSDYGINTVKGIDAEVEKSPSVKKNASMSISGRDGIIYDDSEVYYEAKDVKIGCFIRADSIDVFFRNYNALLYNLVRSQLRMLQNKRTEPAHPCYYKSSEIEYITIKDTLIQCVFSITLRFTAFRPSEYEHLLATEDLVLIVTEDGYAINLN